MRHRVARSGRQGQVLSFRRAEGSSSGSFRVISVCVVPEAKMRIRPPRKRLGSEGGVNGRLPGVLGGTLRVRGRAAKRSTGRRRSWSHEGHGVGRHLGGRSGPEDRDSVGRILQPGAPEDACGLCSQAPGGPPVGAA